MVQGEYLPEEELDEDFTGKYRYESFGVGVMGTYKPRIWFTELMQISVVAISNTIIIQKDIFSKWVVFSQHLAFTPLTKCELLAGSYDSSKIYISPSFP
jgi:hypothetical protein